MSKEPSMEEILSSIKRIIAEEGEEAARSTPRAPRRGSAIAPAPVESLAIDDDGFDELPPGAISDRAEEVLELTDEIELEDVMPPIPTPTAAAAEKPAAKPKAVKAPIVPAEMEAAAAPETILSVESEIAARHSLSALSSMVVKPSEGGDNTLDALVRSMLRPMLKEWLDAQLPEMVEAMVAKEIARITGRAG